MELGSIIGFISGVFFIIVSILWAGEFQVSALVNFFDAASVMITIGGTLAATLIAYPLPKFVNTMKATSKIFKSSNTNPIELIENIVSYANLARKEGILALEEAADSTDDIFMKKGIMLIVDGTDPELTKSILETEITYVQERHKEVSGIWEFVATMGPAWGMIGTLIGLVMMLQAMDDPSSIGPKMAVAIITTFYGSVIANFIATPIATKLKVFSSEEISMKEVLVEGMLSIQAGENPRIIEEKLKSFLAPALRNAAPKDDMKTQEGEE